MTMPQSAVLNAQSTSVPVQNLASALEQTRVIEDGAPVKVKPFPCYNDFVAILQFRIKTVSNIELGESGFKQEGMVVGVGPGLPTANGTRCPSQLKIGEVVAFYGNPALMIKPSDGVYQGDRIIIVPERSIVCRLPAVPFEEVNDE